MKFDYADIAWERELIKRRNMTSPQLYRILQTCVIIMPIFHNWPLIAQGGFPIRSLLSIVSFYAFGALVFYTSRLKNFLPAKDRELRGPIFDEESFKDELRKLHRAVHSQENGIVQLERHGELVELEIGLTPKIVAASSSSNREFYGELDGWIRNGWSLQKEAPIIN